MINEWTPSENPIITALWSKLELGFDIVAPLVALFIFIKWIKNKNETSRVDLSKSTLIQTLTSLLDRSAELLSIQLVPKCIQTENTLAECFVPNDLEDRTSIANDGFEAWYIKVARQDILSGTTTSGTNPLKPFKEVFSIDAAEQKFKNNFNKSVENIILETTESINLLRNFYNLSNNCKFTINPFVRIIYRARTQNRSIMSRVWARSYEAKMQGSAFDTNQFTSLPQANLDHLLSAIITAEMALITIKKLHETRLQFADYDNNIKILWHLLQSIHGARKACKKICVYYASLIEHITMDDDPRDFSILEEHYRIKVFEVDEKIL